MKFSKPIEEQIKGVFGKVDERLKSVKLMLLLDGNLMRMIGNILF